MMLMLINFGPGYQFPYLVIWLPFVFSCRQYDVMTMLVQICKSATTPRAITGLLLQSSSQRRIATTTLSRCASFSWGGTNMDIILLPIFGLGLLKENVWIWNVLCSTPLLQAHLPGGTFWTKVPLIWNKLPKDHSLALPCH